MSVSKAVCSARGAEGVRVVRTERNVISLAIRAGVFLMGAFEVWLAYDVARQLEPMGLGLGVVVGLAQLFGLAMVIWAVVTQYGEAHNRIEFPQDAEDSRRGGL